MKHNDALWLAGCLIMVLAFPSPARADTISVTGGSLQMVELEGNVNLVGERGFALVVPHVNAVEGFFAPRMECGANICLPGDEVSLEASWGGLALSGRLEFEGKVYDDLGTVDSLTSALIDFSGSFIVPPLAPSATVTAPFNFAGAFQIPNAPVSETITHFLTGFGIATISLSAPNGLWTVDAVRYDLSAQQPIPEPGTWLMVGFGTLGLLRLVSRNHLGRRPSAAA